MQPPWYHFGELMPKMAAEWWDPLWCNGIACGVFFLKHSIASPANSRQYSAQWQRHMLLLGEMARCNSLVLVVSVGVNESVMFLLMWRIQMHLMTQIWRWLSS